MENIKVLIDGIQKEVYGLFYIYNSKYYFIYTEKELDENGYVILYMTQVGKETASTPNGPVDTGYMIGVEITDSSEQKVAQESISCIVEDKKNNTQNSKIQYLPMSMLVNFKILSKKRFRLLKSIIVDNFKLEFEEPVNTNNLIENLPEQGNGVVPIQVTPIQPVLSTNSPSIEVEPITEIKPVEPLLTHDQEISHAVVPVEPEVNINTTSIDSTSTEQTDISLADDNVVVDYRTRFFEEEEKNKELQAQIDVLTQKLNDIKNIIE